MMAKKIKTFDITLMLVPIILVIAGVAVIYSLFAISSNNSFAIKQIIFAIIGTVVMVGASFFDYRSFRGINWILYTISAILLIVVLFFGKTTNGATNWLDLKIFQLQPSELAKISLIFSLSAYFSDKIGKIKWQNIIISLTIFAIPFILILKEPDFGTALVFCFIYFVLFLISRPTKIQLFVIFTFLSIVVFIGALAVLNIKPFGGMLHDYQRSRILVFVDPNIDPLGRGYNVKQAQITIGSGGIFGKGLGKGTQSQLQFLPEAHTDFIFAGTAESFGFIGVCVILVLYAYLINRLIDVASLARDNFGMMVSFGIVSMFFTQILINVGMNIGIMPVTGIPLPFMSSGGTSLIVSLFSIGLAESIFIRHKKISF